MHLVEELVARYKRERPGLPAHHLLDAPTLTCWSNDYDFATAFSRQVEAMVRPGDVLVAISTSGKLGQRAGRGRGGQRERGAVVVGLLGRDGGRLAPLCAEALVVPAHATERIQEAHITLIHLLCELVERELFPSASRTADPARSEGGAVPPRRARRGNGGVERHRPLAPGLHQRRRQPQPSVQQPGAGRGRLARKCESPKVRK
jgi:hypothetical protein